MTALVLGSDFSSEFSSVSLFSSFASGAFFALFSDFLAFFLPVAEEDAAEDWDGAGKVGTDEEAVE